MGAPNPDSACAVIEYLMEPRAVADITNLFRYANADRDAVQFDDRNINSDPGIYPPAVIGEKLFADTLPSPQTIRLINRLWTSVKAGQ